MILLFHGILLGIIVLLGLLFLFPMQSRAGIFFGASVPVDFPSSAKGHSLRRNYQLRGIPIHLAALLAGIFLFFHLKTPAAPLIFWGVYFGQIVCGAINWAFATRQVRPYAIRPPLVRTASLARRSHLEITWIGYAAAALPLLLAALYLHTHWAQIPRVFPIHWDFNGRPNSWAHKSSLSVYGTVGTGTGLLFFMMLIDTMLPHVLEMNRKLLSVSLSGGAGLVSLLMTYIALLPFRTTVAAWEILGGSAVGILLVLAVELYSVGWSHSKAAQEPYDGTPDACWYGGMFYFNRNDAALMVPKRSGIGFTFNFGRPVAWWILIVPFLLPILISVFFAIHK
jgi:uncharacterized membrane protein